MAKKKPGKTAQPKKPTTSASERAKRISSLTGKIDQLQQEENKQQLPISDEISSLSKEQQKIMRQLEVSREEFSSETTSHMNNIMGGISRAVQNLSEGVKTVTVSTAKATSDAIKQYGGAISEDISINKQNTVAMALSQATPLFGYFASKFMETDVFKNAASNIRTGVASAAKAGLGAAKTGLGKVPIVGKPFREKEGIPQMQTGGFVKEGGIIKVHAAEVVTPVDKLLKQIDESASIKIGEKLQANMNLLSRSVINQETLIKNQTQKGKDVIQTFLTELEKSRKMYEQPWQDRLLRAMLDLRVGMLGMTNRMQLAWRRTLVQHPTLRNLIWMGKMMRDVWVKPMQWLFGIRGQYATDVKGATGSSNVFQRIVGVLGIIYTGMMPKLDQIIQYTRVSAEIAAGESIPPTKQKTSTMWGKIKGALSKKGPGKKTTMFGRMQQQLGLDPDAMADAGITGFGSSVSPIKMSKRAGLPDYLKRISWIQRLLEETKKLRELKQDQEEREGPHSPSMAQNIAATALLTAQDVKAKVKDRIEKSTILAKISKHTKEHGGILGSMWFILKKAFKSVGGWLLFLFGFVKDFLFATGGGLAEILGTMGDIAMMVMLRGRGGGKGKFFANMKQWGKGKRQKGFGRIGTRLKAFHRAASRSKFGRLLGAGKGAAGRGVGAAARFSGKLLGGTAAVLFMAMDAMRGIMSAEKWGTSKIGGGLGGMLGGLTGGGEGGFKGAMWQGLAGAGLGLMIGGPVGALIGAIAGGMFGFVGGKRMAGMFDSVAADAMKVFKTIKNLLLLPFRSLWKLAKDVDQWVQVNIRDPIWNWVKGAANWVLDFIGIGDFVRSAWGTFSNWWDKAGFDMNWIKDQAANVVKHILFPWTMLTDSLKLMKDFAKSYLYETPVIGGLMKWVFEDLPSDKEVTLQGLWQRLKGEEPHYGGTTKAAEAGANYARGGDTSVGAGGYSDIARKQIGRAAGVRAQGGLVGKDVPYLVGEKGPEYFIPATAGKIMSMGRKGLDALNPFNSLMKIIEDPGAAGSGLMDMITGAPGKVFGGAKAMANLPGKMFNRSFLGKMLADDALGGTEITCEKLDELKDTVGEFVNKAGDQLGAAIINNANYISSNVSNAVSNVSKGGQAIAGGLASAFSSGNASVANVANCNIN